MKLVQGMGRQADAKKERQQQPRQTVEMHDRRCRSPEHYVAQVPERER